MQQEKFVLVTGGMGYIGSHTVVALLQSGENVIVVDDLRNASVTVLEGIEAITGKQPIFYNIACQDEQEMDVLFSRHTISGVIHFAADKAVGESVANPLKYYSNNLESLLSVLRVMEKHKVFSLVFSSSCTVYGVTSKIIVNENDDVNKSTSPYGHSKIIAESILQSLAQKPEWKITLLRYFNPIGAHASGKIGEQPSGTPNNLVPFLMQVANGERETLAVFGNDYDTKDGTCLRDYIHVCDLADAHVLTLKSMNTVQNECVVYNVGTGIETSVLELIRLFEEELNLPLNYTIAPRREGDIVAVIADNTKIKTQLHWNAKYTVKDALAHAWKWEQNRKLL
jgi:UDP-glucose 4-epimerase